MALIYNFQYEMVGLVFEKQMVDMVRDGRLSCVSNFCEYLSHV
jgi:hypothetical protein